MINIQMHRHMHLHLLTSLVHIRTHTSSVPTLQAFFIVSCLSMPLCQYTNVCATYACMYVCMHPYVWVYVCALVRVCICPFCCTTLHLSPAQLLIHILFTHPDVSDFVSGSFREQGCL